MGISAGSGRRQDKVVYHCEDDEHDGAQLCLHVAVERDCYLTSADADERAA